MENVLKLFLPRRVFTHNNDSKDATFGVTFKILMGITESNVDNAVFSVQDEIFRLMSEVIAR